MKIRAIITGVTGMVGEGVLHECLQSSDVESVLVIGRRSCGVIHPKLKEIVQADLFDLSSIEDQLAGYNACYFCLGVSSIGMKEAEYTRVTYDLTMKFAGTLAWLNNDMTFCYVSGGSTDSSEKGKIMWARVKGKTENDLRKLPFRQALAFRPGYMHPTKGLKNTLKPYGYISWAYPVLRLLFPGHVSTLAELGKAMINCTLYGYEKPVLEVRDIVAVAKVK